MKDRPDASDIPMGVLLLICLCALLGLALVGAWCLLWE
jgi:hypothetical protein